MTAKQLAPDALACLQPAAPAAPEVIVDDDVRPAVPEPGNEEPGKEEPGNAAMQDPDEPEIGEVEIQEFLVPDPGEEEVPDNEEPETGDDEIQESGEPESGEEEGTENEEPESGEEEMQESGEPESGEEDAPDNEEPESGEEEMQDSEEPESGEEEAPDDEEPEDGDEEMQEMEEPESGEESDSNYLDTPSQGNSRKPTGILAALGAQPAKGRGKGKGKKKRQNAIPNWQWSIMAQAMAKADAAVPAKAVGQAQPNAVAQAPAKAVAKVPAIVKANAVAKASAIVKAAIAVANAPVAKQKAIVKAPAKAAANAVAKAANAVAEAPANAVAKAKGLAQAPAPAVAKAKKHRKKNAIRKAAKATEAVAAAEAAEATEAPEVYASEVPLFAERPLSCSLCGGSVHKSQARLRSKKRQEWACLQCMSTITKIYQSPTGMIDFSVHNKDKVNAFFEQCKNKLEGEIQLLSSDMLMDHKTDESYYNDGGEFLPLSVYATQGYDIKKIEELTLPCDVRDHRVLGKTYRVDILALGARGSKGQSQSTEHTARPEKRAIETPASAGKRMKVEREASEDIAQLEARIKGELKAKKAEAAASQLQKKQTEAEATSLKKVLGAMKEVAIAHWSLLSPGVRQAYENKVQSAEALIVKVTSAPAGSLSEEVKTVKKDLGQTMSLLKSTVRQCQRFGL